MLDGNPHRLITLPPRVVDFATPRQKADWLDAAAGLDALEVHVRELAKQITRGALSKAHAMARLHVWVRDRIAYVRDPGGREEFADPITVARSGRDDCDGKARLLVALVRSLGDPLMVARIRPVFRGADFVHVQAELAYPGSDGWRLAEVIVKGVGIGDDPENVRDARGKVPLAGPGR
jgi:transglutaminase-like putative cysteine protease